nr:AlNc14C223G9149 [Albugo laibachii Nc14]|eukprot:CCA24125.1 AlNc14C223G9149 [Albugo laibachii Nc14]
MRKLDLTLPIQSLSNIDSSADSELLQYAHHRAYIQPSLSIKAIEKLRHYIHLHNTMLQQLSFIACLLIFQIAATAVFEPTCLSQDATKFRQAGRIIGQIDDIREKVCSATLVSTKHVATSRRCAELIAMSSENAKFFSYTIR